MKNACLLLLTLTIFYSVSAQKLSKIWASTYIDSSAGQLHINDAVVDSNGNSYLAGYKIFANGNYYQTHLFLLKVNASGAQVWIRYFNDTFDSIDVANAVALDADGNVYVTGARIDTFCNICTYNSKISDIITMKYNANGNRVWLNRYHDSIYKLATPTDIAISASGTIIITGNDDTHAIIEKITLNGRTIWIKKPDNIVTNTAGFDVNGHIIIGGASNPDHIYQTEKPLVMELNPNGDIVWTSVFDEYEKNGSIYFVGSDSLNFVYANGQTDTIAYYNNPKIITIKYNSRGKQVWFKKEQDATNTLPHYFGDYKIDASGNSYITGYVHFSSINDDWLTTKYNSAGTRQWISYYDDSVHGSDEPVGLAIAKNGNVFVTGYSFVPNANYTITTIAYNNAGTQLAVDAYKPGRRYSGFAAGIGLDRADNVYVSGGIGSYASPYPSLVVIKYRLTFPPLNQASLTTNISGLKLFPNPVINNLNIVFTSGTSKNYNLIIRDVSGNVILMKQLNNTEKINNISIDVHALHPGIYTVNVFDGINTAAKTFIKE